MPSAQNYINPDGDFVDSHAVARSEVKESWHFSTPSKSPTHSPERRTQSPAADTYDGNHKMQKVVQNMIRQKKKSLNQEKILIGIVEKI